MNYSNRKSRLYVLVLMLLPCGIVWGTKAQEELRASHQNVEDLIVAAIEGSEAAPQVGQLAEGIPSAEGEPASSAKTNSAYDAKTTMIGDNRLPTMMMEEFDVASGGNLGAVLRTMARVADVNLVFSDAVNDLESLSFRMNKPTPWNDVFESILKVHHLSFLQDANMIRIMTLDDMREEYSMQEAISRQTALKSETRRVEPLVLAVVNVKYAKAESLIEVLKEVLEKSEVGSGGSVGQRNLTRGSVSADSANNSVVINAIQIDVDKLVSLTQQMDQPTQQVRIEANIVEVGSQFVKDLGVNWQAEYKFQDNGETMPTVERSVPTEYGTLDDTFGKMKAAVDPVEGMISYGLLTDNVNLNVELTALEDAGKVRILSRPSITTLDNMQASIKVGQDVPYSTTDRDGDRVVEFIEAVLLLEVTPHLIDENTLTMDILTRKDEPDFSQTVDGNPLVQKKEAKTHLILRDGQTTVIAGLSKDNVEDSESGIPILKDIPFLGYLFKYKHKSDTNQELMIFITPRVIKDQKYSDIEQVKRWMKTTYGEELKEAQ